MGMKKIKRIIILLFLFFLVIISAVVINVLNENQVEDVFSGQDIESSVDEYLISQGTEKAKGSKTALTVREGYDFDFDKESEDVTSFLEYIESSVFDTVYLESKYFSSAASEGDYSENLRRVKDMASLIKEKDKNVYLFVCDGFSQDTYKTLSACFDGLILSYENEENAKNIYSVIKENDGKCRLLLCLSLDADAENIPDCDGVYSFITKGSSLSNIEKTDAYLSKKGITLSAGIDINTSMKKKTSPSFSLESLYALRNTQSLETRAFSSYKAVKKDYMNSFTAVKKYITKGIVPDIAFRELSITGYDGNVTETTDFSSEIEICGSYLFPVYINGEKTSLGESGSKRISLDHEAGENVFKIEQNGNTAEYKVNFTFSGEIIRSVFPADEIVAYPKEKVSIVVIACSKAEITVKVGTKEYKAYTQDTSGWGYSAFTATVTMPSSYQEVASLGMVTVIGSLGETTLQKKGAMITAAEEVTTVQTQEETTLTDESTVLGVDLGNFVPEIVDDEYAYTTEPTTQSTTVYTPYIGNQMCIVTVPYADARPVIYNNDDSCPTYSTLVKGTTDYVVNESKVYSSENEDYTTFYELSSGRKVKAEHVQLTNRVDMGKNTLNVLSSYGENGSLKITLSTNWKVPYEITHTPQQYFNANSTKYNLTSFSADYVEIVFYHTIAANGEIDASGSNVISSADWYVSAEKETVTLRMPLRAMGQYYGCSAEYDANGNMCITIHNNPQTLTDAVILLDAGHGGNDPGALGINEQVHESDVNIALTYVVRDTLRSMGATVYLTRQGNETLSLDERKNITYSLKPDLFVSIHCNGSTNSSDIGTSVYYYKGFSLNLANNIYTELLSVFKNNLYQGRQSLYSQISDGTRYYPFSVLRVEDCPAVLVETGYMTNDEECYMLIQSENIKLLGKAIAEGIAKTVAE